MPRLQSRTRAIGSWCSNCWIGVHPQDQECIREAADCWDIYCFTAYLKLLNSFKKAWVKSIFLPLAHECHKCGCTSTAALFFYHSTCAKCTVVKNINYKPNELTSPVMWVTQAIVLFCFVFSSRMPSNLEVTSSVRDNKYCREAVSVKWHGHNERSLQSELKMYSVQMLWLH